MPQLHNCKIKNDVLDVQAVYMDVYMFFFYLDSSIHGYWTTPPLEIGIRSSLSSWKGELWYSKCVEEAGVV